MTSRSDVHIFRRPRQDGPHGPLGTAATFFAALLLAVVSGCGLASAPPLPSRDALPVKSPTTPAWVSGVFLGGGTDLVAAKSFGDWRGRPTEALTLHTGFRTWQDVYASMWLLNSLKEFDGLLVVTVPLMPADGTANLEDVAAGRFDYIFLQVAKEIAATKHEAVVVRVGPTANVPSMPWAATVDNAPTYRAAARHVMGLLKQQVPTLRTEWDIGCGRGLNGTIDRTAALTRLYPGDEVTDVIGCVHFDAFGVRAVSSEEWDQALRPRAGVGLDDVADFARERKKELAVPDWGLSNEAEGGGDDSAFITRMHEFFAVNADILAFESYYEDPQSPRGSALDERNPRAAEEYRRLWAVG